MHFEQKSETYLVADRSWLGGAIGTLSPQPGTLDVSAFDEATHYPNGYLLSGIPLAKATADQDHYVPWDGDAEDGTETIVGFLYDAPTVPEDTSLPVGCAVIMNGPIVLANLPVAVTAADLPDRFWTRG